MYNPQMPVLLLAKRVLLFISRQMSRVPVVGKTHSLLSVLVLFLCFFITYKMKGSSKDTLMTKFSVVGDINTQTGVNNLTTSYLFIFLHIYLFF